MAPLYSALRLPGKLSRTCDLRRSVSCAWNNAADCLDGTLKATLSEFRKRLDCLEQFLAFIADETHPLFVAVAKAETAHGFLLVGGLPAPTRSTLSYIHPLYLEKGAY
jgi:hypothetical protein